MCVYMCVCQADLEMYTEEAQLKRSQIKRSPLFQGQVKRLWELVGSEGKLNKSQYTKMITKICRLIVPPPINKEDLLQTAMDDWEKDLQWAQEHGLVEAEAQELNYESFFRSIYELVDTWTATAQEQEYIDMMKRLIDGVADEFQGSLRWKQDEQIQFDSFFSFRSDKSKDDGDVIEEGYDDEEDEEDGDDDEEGKGKNNNNKSDGVKKNKSSKKMDPIDNLLETEEPQGPSVLVPMVRTSGEANNKKKRKRRKQSKLGERELPLLSVQKVYAKIAHVKEREFFFCQCICIIVFLGCFLSIIYIYIYICIFDKYMFKYVHICDEDLSVETAS
jgi:hypothetical protein